MTPKGIVFKHKKVNSNSGEAGAVVVIEKAGKIEAPQNTLPNGSQNAAYVRWFYEVKIATEPDGTYSGFVKEKISVTGRTVGKMKIVNYAVPISMENIGCGVNLGPVTVSISGTGGSTANYGTSIAGADYEIKIGDLPAAQLGDIKHDYTEVGFPSFFPTKSKSWNARLDQTENDKMRTYKVSVNLAPYCQNISVL